MSIEVKENYTGEYKGIAYEIKLLSLPEESIRLIKEREMKMNGTWYTAYISLSPKYDYSNYDYWNNYIDVHGGFTYGEDTQLGWDYNHLRDNTALLTKEKVLEDVKKAINQYHRKKLIIYLAHKLRYYAFKEKIRKTIKWLRRNVLNIEIYKNTDEETIFLAIYLFGTIRIKLIEVIKYLKQAHVINFIQIGVLK